MNRLRSLIPGFGMLAAVLAVSGCGTGFVNAVTSTPPASTPSPVTPRVAPEGLGVQDYGGHAPLVGAHIYLVQLGAPTSTVTQTYGSVVKNLLTVDSGRTFYSGTPLVGYTYPLTTNVNDQFVPATDLVGQPFKYVTTNQYGESYITGDYTCDAGYPVMFIGYGGSPSYSGASPNTFTVASESATAVSGGTNFTFTTTAPQLFYTGEPVTVSGNSGGNAAYNVTGTVLATGLTSTSFTIMTTATGVAAATTPIGTVTATGTPAFNPAAVNMAVLGLCPTSGNFSTANNGAINYIYMNEVSTTAAAYALAQFTDTTKTNQTGNDEFHIGAPTANLQGLKNAAVTAGLLYDIQGGNSSMTGGFVGENHTARLTTPCPATGMCAVGVVPNTQINTIANSLAACVDSYNTYRAGAGTISTACATLNKYATDNGYFDTTGSSTHVAFNIAQAAFNIARFPQGLGTATTSGGVQTLTAGTATSATNFLNAIYTLPAGANIPFQPSLGAVPNDFSVAIQWNPNNVAVNTAGNAFTDVEIDGNGVAYAMGGAATNAGTGSTNMYALTPSTTVTGTTLGGMNQTLYTASSGLSRALTSGLAIDAINNVWVPGLTGIYKFTPPALAGVQIGGTALDGGAVAVDSLLNQYIPSGNDGLDGLGGASSTIIKQNTSGTAAANFPINASVLPGCAYAVGWTTVDSTGNIWSATSLNSTNGTTVSYVCRFSSTATQQYSFALPNGVTNQAGASNGTGFSIARGLATDKNDNIWFAEKNQDALYMVLKGTTSGSPTPNTQHGRLSAPRGLAVDGANTIWIANTGDTTAIITGGTSSPKYGTGLVQFSDTNAVMTPTYITGAAAVSSASSNTSLASVAIDPSGNVWSAQGSQTPSLLVPANTVNPTLIYEYVGLATPTTTPIAYAKANGLVAAKPGLTSSAANVFRYPAGDAPPLQSCPAASLALGFSTNVSFTVGETLLLSGFQTSTYLNGHMVQVCAAGGAALGGNNLRVTFVDGYAPTANLTVTVTENGAVSAVN